MFKDVFAEEDVDLSIEDVDGVSTSMRFAAWTNFSCCISLTLSPSAEIPTFFAAFKMQTEPPFFHQFVLNRIF